MGNPFIPLAPPLQDPLQQYGRMMQLRSLAQQQQLGQQQLIGAQQENQMRQMQLNDQQAMRQAYIDSQGDPDKFLANVKNGKYGVSFQGIMQANQGMLQMRKAYMDMSKEQLGYQQQVGDTLQGAHDRVLQAPPAQRPQTYQQELQKLGPLANGLPPQYPGDDAFQQMGFSLKTASQMREQALKERTVGAQELTAQARASSSKVSEERLAAELPGGQLSPAAKAAATLPYQIAAKTDPRVIAAQSQEGYARGAGYASARAKYHQNAVIDTANDNKLTTATDMDMLQNPGRYVMAGTGAATGALNKTALLEDIRGNLQQVRSSLQNPKMPEFTASQRGQIAFAMGGKDPIGALQAAVRGGALGNLTAEQQQYLINMAQLTENAMAMRSVLGAGQGSEDLRNAIKATLPGPKMPSKQYGLQQLDAFEKVLNRLERGVPNIPLRNMGGQGGKQQPQKQDNSDPLGIR